MSATVLVMPGCERFVAAAGRVTRTRVTVARFANRELHLSLPGAPGSVTGRPCVIVGSISPPAGAIERLTLVAHALRRAGSGPITALVPYLAYARQDRAADGESLGLEWVGELLRSSGVGGLVCVDAHSERAGALLGLGFTSLSPAGLLAGALPESWRWATTFVAPDEGAIGRCTALARAAGCDQPIVWARKRRLARGVEHLGLVGAPGPRAIVVDDILDTGDTLVACCRALRRAGVVEIGLVVTHGLFTGSRWRALADEGVSEIWVADTVLSRRRPAEARIVPVAPLLAPVLEAPPAGSASALAAFGASLQTGRAGASR